MKILATIGRRGWRPYSEHVVEGKDFQEAGDSLIASKEYQRALRMYGKDDTHVWYDTIPEYDDELPIPSKDVIRKAREIISTFISLGEDFPVDQEIFIENWVLRLYRTDGLSNGSRNARLYLKTSYYDSGVSLSYDLVLRDRQQPPLRSYSAWYGLMRGYGPTQWAEIDRKE